MDQELTDLQKLLIHFTDNDGSDLFITAGRPIAMKKSGKLVDLTENKVTPDLARELCYEIMNHDQLSTFQTTSEANFAYRITGRARYRVNVFVQRGTPGMVIRSVHTEIPSFEELNLPPVLRELVLKKRGLILIVGGTGSGKSTSLASMIGVRNRETQGHIITIEDPIEFVHSHDGCIVTQREVGVDTDSYENALKNTLRQAPDVILIGEIRAQETMEHAIAFAETGHLCLSTLHANNTNQALDRIINFFPIDHKNHLLLDLSLNLRAIISQRLIPKIGGGMIAAVEVLINSPRIAELVMQGKVSEIKEVIAKSSAQGMQTFDQHIFQLYEDGLISYEDALRNADAMNDVRLNIKLNSKRHRPGDTDIGEDSNFILREQSKEE
ncbi:PilT/PilU family type 4a pilus ATPase [Thiomicrorhabdus sp. 6S2-11]|uniref:PilT/PilU family type 4a pilus ATPase n=1 Tax=Thiomicrorhabdus marina TaxID=2818442 RepID=A0ABS3Q2K0_9GAMM|nr:PilT/PilU family type 4a pilus ATPase [Thiomicrorhabdus marina]MBO1926388.1 PilT/PilU family type 4a pilus ATPase [Thiomicrorhabdus marina]